MRGNISCNKAKQQGFSPTQCSHSSLYSKAGKPLNGKTDEKDTRALQRGQGEAGAGFSKSGLFTFRIVQMNDKWAKVETLEMKQKISHVRRIKMLYIFHETVVKSQQNERTKRKTRSNLVGVYKPQGNNEKGNHSHITA